MEKKLTSSVLQPDLRPQDFSDVGQARLFVGTYSDRLRYNPSLDWLFFDGTCWRENHLEAQRLSQELTERQVQQAKTMAADAYDRQLTAKSAGDAAAAAQASDCQKAAETFLKYALQRQKSSAIEATLREACPHLQVQIDQLDSNPFLLNTPAGTVNLRTGAMKAHDPLDYCTRLTGVSPSREGEVLFAEFLDTITVGDRDLASYLQMIAGMFAVGAVFNECLVIAFGSGRNGKSTFFNLLGRVLGDYSGSLSTDVLTANQRANNKAEFAELRGKRFVIAAELEEGTRLDTAAVKKLCSTDRVHAEKKYQAPMDFTPSHSLLLFTNHLPKVGTSDRGTWRRLVVVPFNAVIPDSSERKDFGSVLFEQAGGAVLSWIIEGARRFIEAGYRIDQPECVKSAISAYRDANDWLQAFITECCDSTNSFDQPSAELYARYQAFCSSSGEYCRSTTEFRRALEDAGHATKRKKTGVFVFGLRIKPAIFTAFNGDVPWSS